MDNKFQYRYYSRRVLSRPSALEYHQQRIYVAASFTESEPLQGALVDMFYGCWYEMPIYGASILETVEDKLHPKTLEIFRRYIQKQDYMQHISEYATRWSVLVMPSLNNVASHRLRISSDDSKQIAERISNELLKARSENDEGQIEQLESDFFAHCLACEDKIAFSIVWFRLGKNALEFDNRWIDCRQHLEQ